MLCERCEREVFSEEVLKTKLVGPDEELLAPEDIPLERRAEIDRMLHDMGFPGF